MPGGHGVLAESWWGSTTPPTGPNGSSATWVGTQLDFTAAGRIFGVRVYLEAGDVVPHWVLFWDATTPEWGFAYSFRRITSPGGWHQAWIRPTYRINTTSRYMLAVMFPTGGFFRHNALLPSSLPVTVNNMRWYGGWQSTALDPYDATISINTNANAVDLLFHPD